MDKTVREVVIVGGGTAGWMTASALSHKLRGTGTSITLVESAEIGTVGVGEATLPNIRYFNQMLGIDEKQFMAKTAATFKLGIEFCDWGKEGDSYIHPFGRYGEDIGPADFYHYWVKQHGKANTSKFGNFSFPIVAAKNNRFGLPDDPPQSDMLAYSYAFQFDASQYGQFLSDFSRNRGVKRIEGKVIDVKSCENGETIESIILDSGTEIAGELFIDCSGFRGLLIEQQLKTGYEDWSEYLPCNRAVAVPCEGGGEIGPYTRATARTAGWQWRIPLQHRIGNGHVYCSEYISDQDAADQLLSTLEGKPLADPKQLFFQTGKRRKLWNGNCVAIGLSGGFLEPLESTSIDLIQTGITSLLELWPDIDHMAVDAIEYNRIMDLEFERIRDFLMLHYVANQRTGSAFWNDMRSMTLPDSLKYKIEAFRTRGIVPDYEFGLFQPASWLSVFIGQNVIPENYDPRVDMMNSAQQKHQLDHIESSILTGVEKLPDHMAFIKQYGAAYDAKNSSTI